MKPSITVNDGKIHVSIGHSFTPERIDWLIAELKAAQLVAEASLSAKPDYSISPPQWIALADATPKVEDFPVWAVREQGRPHLICGSVVWPENYTHWLPARAPYAIPEPPKAEPTQRELDDKAGVEAFSKIGRVAGVTAQGFGVGWRAALDYRDAGKQP